MIKIVLAPDSFKGSLTSEEVASYIEKGIKKKNPYVNIKKIPMADGGEGTVKALVASTGGKIIQKKAVGPLGNLIDSFFGILGDGETAVIEMAAASGLTLVPESERNPLTTTTFGTGELIKYALDYNCKKIIIGLGGSATNDGGAGMYQALGGALLGEDNKDIGFGGGSLSNIRKIDFSRLDSRIKNVEIIGAYDVNNPLCGHNGASFIYGPQKGASIEQLEVLDKNLAHFAKIIKNDLNIDIMNLEGAGAAGGLGGGLKALLGAELKRGIDILIKESKFEEAIIDADLLITGEGKIDMQTAFGKTPIGVAKLAKKHDVKVVAICGSIEMGDTFDNNIDAILSIVDKPMTLESAMKDAGILIERTAGQLYRLITLL